jgi:hypothetical protein
MQGLGGMPHNPQKGLTKVDPNNQFSLITNLKKKFK